MAPEPTSAAAAAANTSSLHETAVEAHSNLEKLATGLAAAGADPGVVQGISKIADTVKRVVTALGKGQEQTADAEPPPDEPVPGAEPVQPTQPRTIGAAAKEMHDEAVTAAGGRPRY